MEWNKINSYFRQPLWPIQIENISSTNVVKNAQVGTKHFEEGFFKKAFSKVSFVCLTLSVPDVSPQIMSWILSSLRICHAYASFIKHLAIETWTSFVKSVISLHSLDTQMFVISRGRLHQYPIEARSLLVHSTVSVLQIVCSGAHWVWQWLPLQTKFDYCKWCCPKMPGT